MRWRRPGRRHPPAQRRLTPELEGFLAPFSPEVQALTQRARALVLDVLPDAVETQEGKDLGFGDDPGYTGLAFVLTPLHAGVNLGVTGGASLPDPDGLLQGSGKVHRHVRLSAEADVDRPELRSFLEAAVKARKG